MLIVKLKLKCSLLKKRNSIKKNKNKENHEIRKLCLAYDLREISAAQSFESSPNWKHHEKKPLN